MKFSIFVSKEDEPDFVSRRIMKRYNADFSHIGIIVDNDNEKRVYHSVGKGFSTMPLKDLNKDHTLQILDVTSYIVNHDYALGYLQGRLGVEYSLSQYLGFIFPSLQRFVKNGNRQGICSEEVARFCNHVCKPEMQISNENFDFLPPHVVWDYINRVTFNWPDNGKEF